MCYILPMLRVTALTAMTYSTRLNLVNMYMYALNESGQVFNLMHVMPVARSATVLPEVFAEQNFCG